MANRIETWQIVDGRLEPVNAKLVDTGKTEAYDLESWIASNPSIVSRDLVIIGSVNRSLRARRKPAIFS